MHELQKDILKKLTLTKKAKYSELKPEKTEGNLFSYHLKNLVKDEMILLSDDVYSLTSKGKRYVDRISLATTNTRVQPKIVTLIVLKQKDKYLLYERKRMPFIHHIGFPYGKIHLEERILDAANRELTEKTGLSATLKHRGDVYITVHNEMDLISHMLCHVFTGTKITGEMKSGECSWMNIADVPRNKLIPGVIQIQKLLEKYKGEAKGRTSGGLFFDEFFLNSSED